MRVTVQSRSGRSLVDGGLWVPEKGTVKDLQDALFEACRHSSKFASCRQRLTIPGKPGNQPEVLVASKSLSEYDLRDGSTVTYKDLGPQVDYAVVFFWEYFGPLVVYALIFFFPGLAYSRLQHSSASVMGKLLPGSEPYPPKHPVQVLALAFWSFHYIKRILETFFIHRFSHATMPVANLFKNCTYYWCFAAYVSYFINHPLYTPPPAGRAYAAFGFALLCELANFRCHIIQARLRPSGGSGYSIPHGFLFEYITCANYCAEVYAWLGFTVATQTVAAGLFITAGACQMLPWAAAKHARLRKLFDGKEGRQKYPWRWVMLPPFY